MTTSKLIIFSPTTSPRLKYTLDLLFQVLLPFDYQLTQDILLFQRAPLPKINYSRQRICQEEVFIPMGHLLFENTISTQQITVFETQGLKAFFQSNMPDTDFTFDLFGMIFFLVSRYEEYIHPERDQHQRFPAKASLAFQFNFLKQPLVNQWALVLLEKLKAKFPGLSCQLPEYQFHPTYDVDLAWAYLNRPWWRNMGGLIKSLIRGQSLQLNQRLAVQIGKASDPFFSFPYLKQLHQQYQLSPTFFFLLGDYGPFDKNIRHDRPELHQLIQDLARQSALIGIHPSYRSNAVPERIQMEKHRLENILNCPVNHSRQHFLKLQFPTTYQQLIAAGIQHDYTMGYAAEIGFRASIARPFYWYDLENEKATNLMIHPFQVMDVTLKQYLRLEPDQALHLVLPMLQACREVGGQFCTLWHNSSFSNLEGWAPWKGIYEKLLALASKKAIIS